MALALGWIALDPSSGGLAAAVPGDAAIARAFGDPILLQPGEDARSISRHLRYARDVERPLDAKVLESRAFNETLRVPLNSNFGAPDTRVAVLLAVTNTGVAQGRWLLATKRAAFPELRISEVVDGDLVPLADRNAPGAGANFRAFHGLTLPFSLAPGETRYFVVEFVGVHSSLLPLAIQDPQSFISGQNAEVAMVIGSVLGMLTLAVLAILIYAASGQPNFLWLGVADLVHTVFVLHVTGYTVFYFLHDKGDWLYAVGYALPCLYTLAMTKFARVTLETKGRQPALDRFFRGLMLAAVVALGAHMTGLLTDSLTVTALAGSLNMLAWLVCMLGLPVVAWRAYREEGERVIPLVVGWGMIAAFGSYGVLATAELIPDLPFNYRLYAPVGLLSSFCLTLALVLHLRRMFLDKRAYERRLVYSLQDQLKLSETAKTLERDRAAALATIRDQHHLIHASGHDSQQVLLALNSLVAFVDNQRNTELPRELPDMLRASALQLRDIIATTMSGPIEPDNGSAIVMLGRFRLADLLRQIEMIYRPLCRKKGIGLTVEGGDEAILISDRALLARVISNIVSNAVKFTDKGGITIRVEPRDGHAVLSIEDSGTGIDARTLERLRNREAGRVRADNDTEGTGFGLQSSLAILDRLHGKLELASMIGDGTRALVELPLVASQDPIGMAEFVVRAKRAGLLVVDADADVDADETPEDDRPQFTSDDHSPVLHATFDPSTTKRADLAETARLALLKPLSPEMLDHPAVVQLCTANAARHAL